MAKRKTSGSDAGRKLRTYRAKRDVSSTSEPSGDGGGAPAVSIGARRYLIQKHDASREHYDLRLEIDGVLKSWAVPKGPSLDPGVRRLAIATEDHPIEYGAFEGTIAAGEYGGGTVMLWDRGTYLPTGDHGDGGDPEKAYRRGKLDVLLRGDRLEGAFSLIRMRNGDRSQWLLVKQDDAAADPAREITAEATTSVATGRTMEQIAAADGPVWSDDRGGNPSSPRERPPGGAGDLAPVLATLVPDPPAGADWVFEPKYDGVRVLAHASAYAVRLMTRNGRDKAKQFPALAEALRDLARRERRALVLDGEIVALEDGRPARFQALQDRVHLTDPGHIDRRTRESPVALILFDILRDTDDRLVDLPWTERRARLEKRVGPHLSEQVRLSEVLAERGGKALERARKEAWEGVLAKRVDAPYDPGRRSRDWLKIKLEHRQEFVIGGWTEPAGSRKHLGSLLVGYYGGGSLIHAGAVGAGFTRSALEDLHRRLSRIERRTSPFRDPPSLRAKVHWARPALVAEVRFNEWTTRGKLRQPVFVGLRDDKAPRDVSREA